MTMAPMATPSSMVTRLATGRPNRFIVVALRRAGPTDVGRGGRCGGGPATGGCGAMPGIAGIPATAGVLVSAGCAGRRGAGGCGAGCAGTPPDGGPAGADGFTAG